MNHFQNDKVDFVWVELSRLNRDNRGFMVGSMYITPNVNHSYMEKVHHHLECATSKELLGDFKTDQQKELDKIHKLEGELWYPPTFTMLLAIKMTSNLVQNT